MGFDEKYQSKLFKPFQRLHASYEGQGLGLAACQKIMHNHGGRISAKSRLNQGASFYLLFPYSNH